MKRMQFYCGLIMVVSFSAMPGAVVFCGEPGRAEETVSTKNEKDVTAVVERYVKTERRWRRADYRIEINRREGDTLVVSVIHKDDEMSPEPGGGQSFEVYVDVKRLQVVKEMGFQ